MCETKFIILEFSPIFQFIISIAIPCTAILKFPPWFPIFFVFPLRFPAFPRWFSAPTFPSHFSHSHPYSPHFPHSVLQLPILAFTDSLLSLYSLRIYSMKIVALVKKRSLFLLLHNSHHQIIVSIIHDVISVITKNYLPYSASSKKSIICEVWANNSEWMKFYLSFMSKGVTTCPKLSILL